MDFDIRMLVNLKQTLFDNHLFSCNQMLEKINLIFPIYKKWCEQNKNNFNSDSRFYNKFFGEIIPIYLLSDKLNISNIMIIGKEDIGVDATLFEKNGDISFLECTLAVDGNQRHLQLEHLAQYGHSPVFNDIKTNKKTKASKGRSIIHTESEAVNSDELEKKLIDSLCNAINNKLHKNKESYKNAWLLVSFYRDFYYSESDDERLRNIALTVVSKINNNIFNRIYIMGVNFPIVDGEHFLYEHIK